MASSIAKGSERDKPVRHDKHVERILRKLGVHSRTAAARAFDLVREKRDQDDH